MREVVSYITDYYAPKIGGMERSIEYLSQALSGRRSIEILSPGAAELSNAPDGWHAAVLRHLRSRTGPLVAHLFGFSYRWPREQVALMGEIRRLGGRMVFKVPTLGDPREYLTGAFRDVIPLVDRFVALTPALADELADCGVPPERIAQIPNAIPLDRFRPVGLAERRAMRDRWEIPPDRLIVCFAGRFVRRKRIDLLASALQRLPFARRPLLVLVGYVDPEFSDGTPLDQCLGADVRWIPTQADMSAMYPMCDLYATASEAEGMSNALLEAMACGLPVIATDIAGHAELVEPGSSGWLFPVGDENRLAACLEEAVALASVGTLEELGQRGRERVARDFDIRFWSERYDRLYAELAGEVRR